MHNWDDFRYFLAVVNHGSFSVAARELGVNHSTVSRRIQTLEDHHGVRLLERTRTGYTTTEAGAAIIEVVEEAHDNLLKASRVLLGQDARLEGRIKLTMPHDLFESCMVEPIKRFREDNPAIQLELSVTPGLRDLANREADIAVRFTPKPPDYLVGKCITPLQHGLYVSENLDISKQAPIIFWGGDKQMPGWAIEHFDNPQFALRLDDLVSIYTAVKAGIGIARMPCFFPDRYRDPAIRRLPIAIPRSDWGVWLLSHVDLRNTARINHCKAFLQEELNQLTALFTGQLS